MSRAAITFRYIAIILLLTTSTSQEIRCPKNDNCSCTDNFGDDYQILCLSGHGQLQQSWDYGIESPAFIVNIKPGEYLQVQCSNSPSWSDMPTNLTTQAVTSFYVRSCDLPKNFTLVNLAEDLNSLQAESLVFQSYRNQSDGLESDHLVGFPRLKRLVLSSNGFTSLPRDMFVNLPTLTWLDLRDNSLSHLPAGIFTGMQHLKVLELGSNMIEFVDFESFKDLTQLDLLNIWKNRLRTVEPGTFDHQVLLRTLDLSNNLLENLHADTFAKLYHLETLSLRGNNFSALPNGLFRNNTRLKTLHLDSNAQDLITFPHGLFANLPQLEILKLSKNGLTFLPEDLLRNSNKLQNIDLSGNFLVTLPLLIFHGLEQLRSLELGYNQLETLPEGVFLDLKNLYTLNLCRNHLTNLPRKTFAGLKTLMELNINDNELQTIQDGGLSYLESLQVARFANNHLTMDGNSSLGHVSLFHGCSSLTELHLSGNNVTEIFPDWLSQTRLRKLDLRYNKIQEITTSDLLFASRRLDVDLRNNEIKHILLTPEDTPEDRFRLSEEVTILLDENPLSCGCELHALLRQLEGKTDLINEEDEISPTFSDVISERFNLKVENLRCAEPSSLANVSVMRIREETFTCSLEANEKYAKACPESCNCRFRPHDQALLVDCSLMGLTAAPVGMENPENHPIELDLSGNELTTFPLFDAKNVTVIKLSNNHITDVPQEAIQLLASNSALKVLELHSNNLRQLSAGVLEVFRNFTSLTRLTLHSNPWACNCRARQLIGFVQRSQQIPIETKPEITCVKSGRPVIELTLTELCTLPRTLLISVSLAVALLGLLIGSLAALYYRYQQGIKVWLYAHRCCLWFVTEAELDKHKLYDAFISYSHKDENFVVRELVPKLENGPKAYKLCLHYRDWIAGDWIPAQIARSVEQSRRTIIVLSPNFLESVWGRLEFRAAHNRALSEGRARVIVVLYGEIGPMNQLDPELKAYLSMNTYVKWGDPWFWDKLRYALPHASDVSKDALRRKRIFEKQQPSIRIEKDDKKELVYSPTPGTSTPPAESAQGLTSEEKMRGFSQSCLTIAI